MPTSYAGPLRREPLAVELHNTLYASAGETIDGIETPEGVRAWLDGISDRLPAPALDRDASRHREFLALRTAVREALHAAIEGKRVPARVLKVLNKVAALAPVSPLAVERADGELRRETCYHAADATDIALGAIAADAIELLGGPGRVDLRACGAPGCVLMFLKDHPRRTWCSAACGNRARQARHYERARRARR
jgi:predicted RNA-binding Zn ribbon-like protein